ncbi:DUF3541 domain-containing protein [Billgrantia gudaonensis]|uniref:DUF3541 domain-containing protein n=1 Tax=Billgrantia gudaonensis TaxID=376427 RepID=A0A1G9A2L5_9GAMM|nr:DUF3541 domain-containing protein [Halomonas gudaonensis]SDK21487.1 protein of unknown function [Halomonas gudaonensis]
MIRREMVRSRLGRWPAVGWSLLVFLVLLAGCASVETHLDASQRERQRETGLAIQAVYDAALPELPPAKQRHYAQRLYRLTGEARYVPFSRAYGRRLVAKLEADIVGLEAPDYAAMRSREIVVSYPQRTAKQRARRAMLAEWGELPFARRLLARLIQAEYHGLLTEVDGHERALDYLAEVDWKRFLTDPQVLRTYAAQVGNYVHFLHQLGVTDLREPVVSAFRAQYPPGSADGLDDLEYRNYLYGMTHFVIAASRYYQQRVDPDEFAWILDRFERELETIRKRATEDIQAEVALSFLLAGREAHPAVARLREALVAAVDPTSGIIPSPAGSSELAGGEHRNVLAIMVLRWPGRLHQGPRLDP